MNAQGPSEGARRGLAGRMLGDRYRVVRMVSAGANTLIADAEDTELGRAVTVKLVRPEIAEAPEFRRRFVATMRAMAKLSHPNLAAVHDWGEEEVGKRTTVYAVVEHLAGGSLRDLFDRGRRLEPSQALMVGLEACRGLDFAHHKGLVHGELTPSKLVFGDDRRLRIVDFGLARLLGADDWKEPASVPTHVARYSSPELALGQPVDGKSDVYSLALILVEAVSGSVPFAARSTVATLSARVGRLMPVSADLGPLAAVLERAGRPDPVDRFTASEFGRGLVRAAEKLPRPAPIPIVLSTIFEEDPSQLRRPNDPTGGLDRPPPEPFVALVPPVAEAAPAASDDVGEPMVPASPEERAAGASSGDAAVAAAESDESDEPDETDESDTEEPAASTDADADAAGDTAVAVDPADDDPAATDGVSGAADVNTAAGAGHDLAGLLAPGDDPAPAARPDDHAPRDSTSPTATLPPPVPTAPGPSDAPSRPPPPSGPAQAGRDASPYDGDDDLLRDELAALARPPVHDGAAGDHVVSDLAPAAVATPSVAATGGATGASSSAASSPPDVGPVASSQPPPDDRRRRRWVPWVVALAVVGALAGLGFLALQLFEVPKHPVPELVGADEEAARAQTAGFDWDVEVRRERSDEHPEPGEIIRTVPTAGRQLAEEEPFLIVVSEGPELRVLEDLVGLTRAEAETTLAQQRLVALPPVEQHDETVPVGTVVSWSVPDDPALGAGGEVLPDTPVQVVLSIGPAPRTIPALVGTTVEQATAALQAIQLGVTVAEPVFSDDIPAGSVVSADPPDGTGGIVRDTAVTITPSKGVDLVTAPPLAGFNLQQIRDALTASGLQVGSVLGNTQGLIAEASVAGETYAVGGQYRRGSAVDLVLF